jgi:RNA polymerase sigma-70 factor (ECF subfamily)
MLAPVQQNDAPSRISDDPTSQARRAANSSDEAALDAKLVRHFKAGDEGAFVTIVARYRNKMFAIALRHLRNHADAEEIAQDTFIRAHRGLANFRGESSLSTWLHRIAFNLSRNRHKHNFSRRRHVTYSLDCALIGDDRATFSDLVASDAPTPERVATSREFSELVLASMKRLGVLQCQVLEMRNGQGQSYGDIARDLGISIGTVKSRIGRARESLRVLLAQSYPDLQPDSSLFEWFEPMRPGGKVAIAFA